MPEKTDPPAHRPPLARKLATEHARGALVGTQERGENAQQRGFPGAVGPEDRERRARRHGDGDTAQGSALAVVAPEIVQLDGRLIHGSHGRELTGP